MSAASTTTNTSTKLRAVAARARNPQAQFHALAYLIDTATLRRAFQHLRANAAVGVDGVTKEQYGQNLEENLQNLHRRLKEGRYRHQPIRRVHIPKDDGKLRPLGISTTEDKIVQGALTEVLQTVFEPLFMDGSYGCRPNRRPHDAMRALDRAATQGRVNWVYEADIRAFFDHLNRKTVLDLIQTRVPDGSLLRLVGKCLHVGVLDGEEFSKPEVGTPQGSILSPLLGNVYLHFVLDAWFAREVQPRLKGKALLVRYCDDFVIGFELKEDAERVATVLPKRMERFGLTLHPEKTRLIRFERPPRTQTSGKGPGTFDFLGFTCYWKRTLKGRWQMALKTRHGRLRKSLRAIYEYCRDHRHNPVKDQHASLVSKLQGHFNYYGVNGNLRCLQMVKWYAEKAWFKWLSRRGQKHPLTWERFEDLLVSLPLPRARIIVQIWA